MKRLNHSGFTMVEMMISVALVGFVVSISVSSYLALAKASAVATQWTAMHSQLRDSFTRMTKDIVGANQLIGAGGNYITVEAQRTSGDQIVYYIHSDRKLFQYDTTLKEIAGNVEEFDYTLYEDDGVTVTSNPTNAASIDILVRIEKQFLNNTYEDVLQTRVLLRNK